MFVSSEKEIKTSKKATSYTIFNVKSYLKVKIIQISFKNATDKY